MNIFKKVELYTKYRKVIPEQHWHEDLYSKPNAKIIQAVRKERNARNEFKKELNIEKKKVQNSLKAEKKTELQLGTERRTTLKEKVESITFGHDV